MCSFGQGAPHYSCFVYGLFFTSRSLRANDYGPRYYRFCRLFRSKKKTIIVALGLCLSNWAVSLQFHRRNPASHKAPRLSPVRGVMVLAELKLTVWLSKHNPRTIFKRTLQNDSVSKLLKTWEFSMSWMWTIKARGALPAHNVMSSLVASTSSFSLPAAAVLDITEVIPADITVGLGPNQINDILKIHC